MQDITLLATRMTVGGYLAAHGAQKLFGAFGGHGLEGTGGFFQNLGLAPGRPMAALAGASELGGGVLTAAGLADPVGPVAIASTMAVAAGTAHRGKGPFAASGGPELPLTNLAAALALAATGPGRYSLDRVLGVRLSRPLLGTVVLASVATAAALVARSVRASSTSTSAETPGGTEAGPPQEESVVRERSA
jgi:putative oxidoreductase